jgi:hypothetical protein
VDLITPKELDAIDARAAAATAEPWVSLWTEKGLPALDPNDHDEVVIEAPQQGSFYDKVIVGSIWYDGPHAACSQPNAAFIASARSDVPRLSKALRAAWARIEQTVAIMCGVVTPPGDLVTPEKLAEIRARIDHIQTRGRWTTDGSLILPPPDDDRGHLGEMMRPGDAAFVAAAPEDMPALVRTVERAWKERDEAREQLARAITMLEARGASLEAKALGVDVGE